MKPYFHLEIGENLSLVIPELSMMEEFYQLVDSDREHLRRFLDFVDGCTSVDSQIGYYKMKMTGNANGTDKLFYIADDDRLIGCVDLHFIDAKNKKAEIGYWLHSSCTGKNIMTRAVKKLCQYAFEVLELNKLTIIADVENLPSNRVAVKAGLTFVGLKRQDVLIYGEYQDMNEYCLLRSEWR